MGIRLGIQQGANPEYCESVRRLSEIMWLRMRSPWFWNQPLWYLSGYGAETDRHLKIVQGFTEKVIASRKTERKRVRSDSVSSGSSRSSEQEIWEQENLGTKARRQAFLDLLLEMQEENKLSDSDIREEVDTFMFEGHDTVSSAMGFTVYMVAHHPEVQEKIFEELKGILEPDETRVTHEDISRMRYLEQCIRETLRMFPTVPIIGRVIQDEIDINGFRIPKGITAMIAPFAVHRDKHYYENPDVFDPDNFAPEKVSKRNPFAYIPFSAGPRNCIGQKFAMMEMKVVLSRFFLRFKAIPSVHELENRGLPELVLRPKKGCPIRIVRRKES
uniref:Cytochrome P450 n=1 Tax=Panagrolaimus sp. JU765 TaxID=591449 RepID=A0AC34QSD9_9BILA